MKAGYTTCRIKLGSFQRFLCKYWGGWSLDAAGKLAQSRRGHASVNVLLLCFVPVK